MFQFSPYTLSLSQKVKFQGFDGNKGGMKLVNSYTLFSYFMSVQTWKIEKIKVIVNDRDHSNTNSKEQEIK